MIDEGLATAGALVALIIVVPAELGVKVNVCAADEFENVREVGEMVPPALLIGVITPE
jgi:hypothetical protein